VSRGYAQGNGITDQGRESCGDGIKKYDTNQNLGRLRTGEEDEKEKGR